MSLTQSDTIQKSLDRSTELLADATRTAYEAQTTAGVVLEQLYTDGERLRDMQARNQEISGNIARGDALANTMLAREHKMRLGMWVGLGIMSVAAVVVIIVNFFA